MSDNVQIRSAAFQRVRELEARFGDAIPWSAIEGGFNLHDKIITAEETSSVMLRDDTGKLEYAD